MDEAFDPNKINIQIKYYQIFVSNKLSHKIFFLHDFTQCKHRNICTNNKK